MWPIKNWFMVDLSSKDAPGTKTVKRNQLEWLRSNYNIIRHWMGIFAISTCTGFCSSRFNMSMKSVKVTTIQNHEAIWKSSKLSFPIWFCPCFHWTQDVVSWQHWSDWIFFSQRFLVCFDVTMARSLVDSLYGRLEGVLVRACSACGVWNWWIQMGQCMLSFNRWVAVSIFARFRMKYIF